jgi:subtilisin family serine protease
MPNQKLDNQLNLAMEVPEVVRERSMELETGFDPETRKWELIVKYSGSLDDLRELGITVDEMLNEYAIITVPEDQIDIISRFPRIEYIEKPKRLYFVLNRAKAASCINQVQLEDDSAEVQNPESARELAYSYGVSDEKSLESLRLNLTGKGVITAVLDSGIDYFHEDFRNADGTTRIIALWDQSLGKVYTQEEINYALANGWEFLPSTDLSGHGTAVAGIAAGNGRAQNGRYRGVAYESDILVVKLGTPTPDGFPRTTELMRAVNFAVAEAIARNQPIAINISFGNTYGSHDGSSLLETFLDDISSLGRTSIIVGSGNEAAAAGHTSGDFLSSNLTTNVSSASFQRAAAALPSDSSNASSSRTSGALYYEQNIQLSVSNYESGFSVQLWKSYEDQFTITLQTPSGESFGPISETLGVTEYEYRNTRIYIYYGKPSPYSVAQEIYFDFIPEAGNYVPEGIWSFRLQPEKIVHGSFDFWLPGTSILNTSTRFLSPTPDTTLTIPSTASKVITVGAYDTTTNTYADFSGRGYTRRTNQIKPDLVAPGIGLMAPAPGSTRSTRGSQSTGSPQSASPYESTYQRQSTSLYESASSRQSVGTYQSVTGTSFAAPMVTGSAALLMQWGILNQNDPFLYGEKLKACLRRAARPLPAFPTYPNPQVGYGALCVSGVLLAPTGAGT